ncbi:MAG: histidinol-phosphatase [Treponema sp.]|nr:histidinol-phosphatase [Treponema sp.]
MKFHHKINLHTHCTFCDGKDTAEDMVKSAIKKGFTVLGFSSHSIHPLNPEFYIQPDDDWHIHNENLVSYTDEINRLKVKYAGQIDIFTGFEADYFESPEIGSSIPDFSKYKKFKPDYLIGSVHFVNTPNGFYTVDNVTESVQEGLKRLYGIIPGVSDAKEAVCDYFEAQRNMLKKGDFNILGHADLIRKRNGVLKFFSEDESWYKEQINLTVKAIKKSGVSVEINTGAIARGIMDDVYPASYMMEKLYENGIPVCVNSDSHNIDSLDTGFEKAYSVARKAGYKELVYPLKTKTFIIDL